MLRKSFLLLGCCIPLVIGLPPLYSKTDRGPEPTTPAIITSTSPLPPATDLRRRNAVPSLPRFCDESPCTAIRIIYGVTTRLPCEGQVGCITYAKGGLMGVLPTFVTAVQLAPSQALGKASTSSESTGISQEETTTYYVYVTEEIKPSSSRVTSSATTLAPISTALGATTSSATSYMAGVVKAPSIQSYSTPALSSQPSSHISTTPVKSSLTKTISVPASSHLQSMTSRLSSLQSTMSLKIPNTLTSTSTTTPSTSIPTYGASSVINEVSAMPVVTHTPTSLVGFARIGSVITDISLLMSILSATPTLSPMGSAQSSNPSANNATTTKASMATPSSQMSAPLGGNKSITSTRTITRTALAPTITGQPNRVDKSFWSPGKKQAECACQCNGKNFNITIPRPV
ncbi:hypothetical protein L873DRAFT_1847217 [Choiromyces venosus 120613-1]|uniref:Uncharacterized protein n=1 Tax=Choiromyces venosus 120613-1 TaxID=1336337 RepID=A0A3N4J566_9PEZI|nr:hypothetical protein L873DRAFT_1847217 [Choiromyces venosus 120613-1]